MEGGTTNRGGSDRAAGAAVALKKGRRSRDAPRGAAELTERHPDPGAGGKGTAARGGARIAASDAH
jgi:hypothetical protein